MEMSTLSTKNDITNEMKVLFIFIAIWQFAYKISNNAITNLLAFLKFFVQILGGAFKNKSDLMPLNLKALHKCMQISEGDFITYVVCPECDSIYEFQDCIITRANGNHESKRCCHVAHPKHPQVSRRKPCGEILLKKVRTKSGYSLKPIKVYPYMPLEKSFARLVKKDAFVSKCEKWRSRATLDQTYSDVYDGQVWQYFNSVEGKNFLSLPHCYLLTMNVDWFEPFERGIYSVGAIYLTVQNLPREERYKPENIILAAIIPGPKEPKLNINSFLTPLILDLKEAWTKGFTLSTSTNSPMTFKLALSCVACDIPASRKVCGFLSHNASLGCNKCLKKFDVQFAERTNYSGFDREIWCLRSMEQHRQDVNKVLEQVTKTGIELAESQYGVRYSVLLALPYFDPVKFTVIDCMHNLFLGTPKHLLRIWIDRNLLTKDDMVQLECKLKLFRVPADIGRVPSNVLSSYAAFTAAQWRNWITIYSPIVLKGLLPHEHLQCWLLFVQACCLLCSRIITRSDIICADLYLLNFCKKFERLYPDLCTPNLHLHLHLKDSFLDFGPPHAFWCFAFERYNGILGSYYTNKKEIEVQLMKKFCQNQAVQDLSMQCDSDVYSLLSCNKSKKTTKIASSEQILHTYKLGTEALDNLLNLSFHNEGLVVPFAPFKERVLDSDLLLQLITVYRFLYPQQDLNDCSVLPFYNEYGHVTLAGDLIGSTLPGPHNSTSAIIMSDWPGADTGHLDTCSTSQMRVGCIKYFIKHEISFVKDSKMVHIFAYVGWKKRHQYYDYFGKSAMVCENVEDINGPSDFIPVQRIAYRCAHSVTKMTLEGYDETVFIACPVPIKHFM